MPQIIIASFVHWVLCFIHCVLHALFSFDQNSKFMREVLLPHFSEEKTSADRGYKLTQSHTEPGLELSQQRFLRIPQSVWPHWRCCVMSLMPSVNFSSHKISKKHRYHNIRPNMVSDWKMGHFHQIVIIGKWSIRRGSGMKELVLLHTRYSSSPSTNGLKAIFTTDSKRGTQKIMVMRPHLEHKLNML